MKRSLVLSKYYNLTIFILSFISTVWMMSGYTIVDDPMLLSAPKLGVFKFFTVDSNIFAGIVSLILFLHYKKNKTELTKPLWLLKLMAASGVGLTFLVTVGFLAPTSENGFITVFVNSNFFFHLVIPLLSMYSFIRFENRTDMPLSKAFYGLVPVLVYGIYYLTRCFTHIENGVISSRYDFYGFFFMGAKAIPLVLLILFISNSTISMLLVYLNKKKAAI